MIALRARLSLVDRARSICYHERPFFPAAIRVIENINSNDVQIHAFPDSLL